ncbi:YdcH family protein [Rodentibacter pneumotropicus]|uniref:YdcH family protein n=1 Tax=Rodentibacter pneumotropicus TaxID=758 RepID=UPI00232F32C1|nr:YdcH family protein [Rodentibacter pneumotropicus]MDC2824444.1 YdcH family protein [Rodentibacter pneumotropicus]
MFPEFRGLITKLKNNDAYFERLFNKHNELDQYIKNKEENIQLATHTEIEILKKEKLRIKDELYAYLKKKAAE